MRSARCTSLKQLIIGLIVPPCQGCVLVNQPNHAQFVIYSVPDDVATALDCESRLTLANPDRVKRVYGNYFGVTFYVDRPHRLPGCAAMGAG